MRVYLYSTITGEEISSAAVIPPEGRFDVSLVLENFKEETIDFVCEYFGDIEVSEKMIEDFDESIDDMKRLLIDISKSK